MYLSRLWIFYITAVLSMFDVDVVEGQTNNVLSGTRFNITIEFNVRDSDIVWIRDRQNLRDASVDETTGFGCIMSSLSADPQYKFYCEENGTRYILELESLAADQGIIYTADPPAPAIQYAVIDKDHTTAITYHTPSELKDSSITINCTVACTPSGTSITVYVKQNDTEYLLGTPTPESKDCSTIGFQTITVSSNVTPQFVHTRNITKSFTILFTISFGGKSVTIETAAIEIVSDNSNNTLITASTITTTSQPDTTLNSTNSTQPGTAADTGKVVCDDSCIGGIVGGILAAVIVIIVGCGLYFRKKVPSKPEGPLEMKPVVSNKTGPTNSVTICWKPPKHDGRSPVTGYIIEYRPDKKGQDWKEAKTVSAETLTCVVDELTEGASYLFQVSAKNAKGRGEPLVSDGAVTIGGIPGTNEIPLDILRSGNNTNAINSGVPSKPEGPLEIKPVVSNKTGPTNSVTICWKPPKHDECSAVTGYIIEYRPDKKGQDWKEAKTVGAETCTCVVDKLTEGASYLFQVFAKNAKGRGEPLVSDGAVTIGGIPVAGTIETSLTNPPSGNNTDANNSGLPENKRAPKIGQTPESPEKKTTNSPARPLPQPSKSEQNIPPRPLPQLKQQPLPPIKSNSKY